MKKTFIFIAILFIIIGLIGCNGGKNGDKKVIVIDGGGDIGNFNSTPSMTKSAANPFPYNTLEVLAREWEELNPEYRIEVRKTSNNGDRSIITPQLNNKTAPDILYQNGTVVNMDIGKDYYVILNEYFDQPNKYVEGNERWRDLYAQEELAQNLAADGNHYYATLEKVPVGILYNKDIFAEAEVDVPNTYAEFLDVMATILDKTNKEPYATTYTWYDIVLEASLFSDILEAADVLRKNGYLDTEEFVRAYELGIWEPTKNALGENPTLENNRYYEYIKLTKEKTQYYPNNWQSYDAHTNFVNGNIAMVEVTGREIRRLSINENIDFEWDVMPFPDLTEESTNQPVARPSIRGVAGLATPWFITNSAVKKDTVEGCVDFLMYVTAPENNNRLIGDLKGGIPLNPNEETEIASYLESLLAIYQEDMESAQNNERTYWGAVFSWGNLGYAYNTAFIKTLQDIDNGVQTIEQATISLAQTIRNTITALKIENDYDQSKW